MNRRQFALCAAAGSLVLSAGAARADDPPTTWDGLVRVPSKKLKYVYLAPGADFRPYTKVMIDPTEIAFDKKWMQQYNESVSPQAQLTAYDIREGVTQGIKAASDVFDQTFASGGYQVVSAPGPDVLRVRTAILDIIVAAPDVVTMGHVYTNSEAAGAATFVLEGRDSQTNALLGRAIDSRRAGDDGIIRRNSVTNRSDFRELAKTWAKISVAGLNELKSLSPLKAAAGAGPAG
jgi:hypothetical protein